MAVKAQKQTYFIRVPRPTGAEFVDVVPEQLSLSLITEIYEKDLGSGKARYIRSHGIEALVNTGLDISDLSATIAEVSEKCADSLAGFGEAGEKVAALLEALRLGELVKTLAAQDVQKSRKVAEEALHAFLGKACELAGELAECKEKTERACDAMVGVSAVIDRAGLATDDYYTDWAVAVENMNRAVEALEGIESDLRERRSEIEKARRDWLTTLDSAHPDVAAATQYLDHPTEGFWMKACQYRGEPEKRTEMEQSIAEAEKHISVLKGFEALAAESWERYGGKIFKEVYPLRDEIRRLCGELGEAWTMLNDKECNSHKGAPRPQEAFGSLVTDQAYNCAVDRMRDQKWGKLTAERRLLGLIESIDGLRGEKPRLPADIREVVGMSEKSIEQIRADWRERDRRRTLNPPPGPNTSMGLLTGAPTIPALSPPALPRPITVAPTRPATAMSDEATAPSAEKLYELMVCVGYVLTAMKWNSLTCTTLVSASRILVYLGACTEAQAQSAKDGMKQLLLAEAETLKDGIPNKARWHAGKVRWLRYHNGRAWVLKLTEKSGPEARSLMAKHGLTEAAVRDAYARMKADREIEFRRKTETD